MANEKLTTGVDDALRLDAIYYSAPIPQNLAVLTVMGAVFDKVYFPGVCMPLKGFDQAELDKEIKRVEQILGNNRTDDILVPMLKFIRHAKTLEGFCEFSGDYEHPFDHSPPQDVVRQIYDAIHGKPQQGWEPSFRTNNHKAIPGSDEHITYPGPYHYLASAIRESGQRGIPLLNDTPGLPIPGLDGNVPVDDAKILATIIAIECTKLVLPQLPILRPEDLMEFRADNIETLRMFRRSMLRYAADLNKRIGGIKPEELEHKTKFFVQTEIVPVLDELQAAINAPARAWWRRGIDFVKVAPELVIWN